MLGGPGRPPSEVRRVCRESFFSRIPVLEEIADGKSVYVMANAKDVDMDATLERLPSAGERVRAVSELGKIGMGGHISLEDARTIASTGRDDSSGTQQQGRGTYPFQARRSVAWLKKSSLVA